jgi:hypothetical protein
MSTEFTGSPNQPPPTRPPIPPAVATARVPVVPPTRPAAPSAPATKRNAPSAVRSVALLLPLLIGGGVSVSLGVYGRLHTPSGIAVDVAGFSSPLTVKVWLACGAVLLAFVQLLSALAMWGRLGGFSPSWAGTLHRWSGRLAFLLTVPVAMHCLYAFGFATYSPRVLVHSLLGCFFYGAFTAKMLLLPKKGLAGWTLPVIGGAVFTALIGVWMSSSVWFFATNGVRF